MFAVGDPGAQPRWSRSSSPTLQTTVERSKANTPKKTHTKGRLEEIFFSSFFHCLKGLVSQVFISDKKNGQPPLLNTGTEQPLFQRENTPPTTLIFASSIQNGPLILPRGHRGEPSHLWADRRCLPGPVGLPGPLPPQLFVFTVQYLELGEEISYPSDGLSPSPSSLSPPLQQQNPACPKLKESNHPERETL